MSVKLIEVFTITEDSSSARDRGLAYDVYARVQEKMNARKHASIIKSKKGHEGVEAFFDVGKLVGDESLVGLTLSFDFIDNTTPSFAEDVGALFNPPPRNSTGDQGIITIYVRNIEGTRTSHEKWKQQVVLRGAEILKEEQQLFVHEFVHYLDQKNEGYDDYHQDGDEKYYNDPREVTAHLQQSFTALENKLLSGDGDAIINVAEKGKDSFLNAFKKRISGSRFMNKENMKTFETKVEEFRNYILKKYGE